MGICNKFSDCIQFGSFVDSHQLEGVKVLDLTARQTIKAVSILQPWASLIAVGAKKVEIRSWKTDYRGPLAIHASKAFPKENRNLTAIIPELKGEELYFGHIITVVNLVDCARVESWDEEREQALLVGNNRDYYIEGREFLFGNYTPDRYGWILENITPIEPIQAKGRLGLWDWTILDNLES